MTHPFTKHHPDEEIGNLIWRLSIIDTCLSNLFGRSETSNIEEARVAIKTAIAKLKAQYEKEQSG